MCEVKGYVRGATPVARSATDVILDVGASLKGISQPRFWSTWRSTVLACHLAPAR